MNKNTILILMFMVHTCIQAYKEKESPAPITLSLARISDGSFITIYDIHNMIILGQSIQKLLKKTYLIEGKEASLAQLIEAEKNGTVSQQYVTSVLEELTKQFLAISKKCLEAANASKNQFFPLIRQWSHERNPESQLLAWAHLAEKEEGTHFKKTVTSLVAFQEFCLDLTLFLNDVIHNCPKAYQQFKKRMDKLHVVHEIAVSEFKISAEEGKNFISYMVHLPNFDTIGAITTEVVSDLLYEFRKTNR